jgi:hypothetical protein
MELATRALEVLGVLLVCALAVFSLVNDLRRIGRNPFKR